MNDFVAWSGWALTIIFGALSVVQFIHHWIDRKINAVHNAHIIAACESLQSLRLSCQDAIDTGTIVKTDAARHYVRQLAWNILTIENQLAAIIQPKRPLPADHTS